MISIMRLYAINFVVLSGLVCVTIPVIRQCHRLLYSRANTHNMTSQPKNADNPESSSPIGISAATPNNTPPPSSESASDSDSSLTSSGYGFVSDSDTESMSNGSNSECDTANSPYILPKNKSETPSAHALLLSAIRDKNKANVTRHVHFE